MSVLQKLASALGRRDEVPNQELARQIVTDNNEEAVKELIDNLSNKSRDIRHDCIKVLYEIGEAQPSLISVYDTRLIALLDSKDNRMQWGAMTALNTITGERPDSIFTSLPKLIAIAEAGSIITKDNLMAILVKLCAIPKYAADAFDLHNEQLSKSLPNQLPMYAERALPIINAGNVARFVQTLTSRLNDIEKESGRQRIGKVIKKLKT